jgi:sulfide:quinone oxidoreductase
MTIKLLTPTLSVCGQILPQDMGELAAAGFRSVICNRPDGEGTDQPTFADIRAAAAMAGLQAQYLPIVPGKASDQDALAFAVALDNLPKPILAFCRTGARSATLWTMSEAGRMPKDQVVPALGQTASPGLALNQGPNR